MKNNRCIITGVDVSKLPFGFNEDSHECQNIKTNLLNNVIMLMEQGVDEFYTDCSFGFALWGGEIVTALMKYNDIMLYVVYPYENQPYSYAPNWQDRFYKVHELSTDVIPMYTTEDIDGNISFSDDDADTLFRKAADYMLGDCGRLLFCGDNSDNPDEHSSYIYKEAVKRGYDIMILTF